MSKPTTLLAQILRHVPRPLFDGVVARHGGDRRVRRLNCWTQFVALAFAQLSGRRSLRDLEASLHLCRERLLPLQLGPVRRSTLSDANAKRPVEIYRELFGALYQQCRAEAPGHRFRFKNPLYALDASVIDLCLSLFPWADFKATKGAIKLHALLDLRGQIPSFVDLTTGAEHEIHSARRMKFEPGSILVFDRGYVDYAWFHYLHLEKVFFVSRLKKNVRYRVLERRPVNRRSGITSDQVIVIQGMKAKEIPVPLRRVRYVDPETGKIYVYLTNIQHLAASTIAAIYKERWQVEIFFRWIKQHLKIKTFMGTHPAAVLTQIHVALCAYLLLAYLRFLSRQSISLHRLIGLLQVALLEDLPLEVLWEFRQPPAALAKAA